LKGCLTMNRTEFDLAGYLAKKRKAVESGLERTLGTLDPGRELVQAMGYSVMAGGKRVRPVLAMAAAAACGKDEQIALPAACAIEMIHTYSLIHDDLPAMDDDDLRRGLATCHKKFSEATAILAGDGLLTHAFFVLAAPQQFFDHYPEPGLRLELVEKISRAAGASGMVEGQMMDMQAEKNLCMKGWNKEEILAHLKAIHRHKTGQMIRVSVQAGAISAGGGERHMAALTGYADHIGLAFQVMDDILNVEGDPDIMGKAVGSDVLNDKLTFPGLIGLSASKAFCRELIDNALAALDGGGFGPADRPLRAIARYIISRKR